MQMVVHFLYMCNDINHSLNLAFMLHTTILHYSEEKRKLNAMGIQLAELEAPPVWAAVTTKNTRMSNRSANTKLV